MKLIIDIDEDVRIAISRMGLLRIPDEMQKKVDKAIQHGTPLDRITAKIEERKEKEYLCFDDDDMNIYITGLNDAIGIIDKYETKAENIEVRATEFLAEARACAEK